MLTGISNQTPGVMSNRAAPNTVRAEAAESRPQPRQAKSPEAEADDLKFFLGNITKADAAAVIALTQPSKSESTASYGHAAAAYGEF